MVELKKIVVFGKASSQEFFSHKVTHSRDEFSSILCLLNVKTSEVNVEERNPHCLLFRRLFLLRRSRTPLLIIDSKSLLMTLGRYYNLNKRSPTFLKRGHTADTFLKLENHFSFKQWLKNFTNIRYSSRIRFNKHRDFIRTSGLNNAFRETL